MKICDCFHTQPQVPKYDHSSLFKGQRIWIRHFHIYRYIMDNDPITKYQGMESEGARLNVHNYTHGDAHAISTMIGNISPTLKLK